MKLVIKEEKRLQEQDVEIEVKHEGILEVPEGKNVDDLPMSHFEKLVKKHGLSKITRALNNLQVWNKNDDKKLSKWAGDMIDKLTKKYGKNESVFKRKIKEGWTNKDWIISFQNNDDLEADLEEFLFDVFSDNPDVFGFDWQGKNTYLYLNCNEDDYDYIKWFIEDWKDKHIDEYEECVSESVFMGKIDKIDTNESFIKEFGAKSYWSYDLMDVDDDRYYDKQSIRRIRLTPCDNPDDCYADFGGTTSWAVCDTDYGNEVFCTKDQAYSYLLDTINRNRYEREHDI